MATPTETVSPTLYEHQKRREWGVGILAWEQDDKRAYLFEDGQLRVFAKEFYPMLRETDRPPEEVLEVYEQLASVLEANQTEGPASGAGVQPTDMLTFADQVAVFEQEFPQGFEDPAWTKKVRGDGKKRLKRHREPAIEQARNDLAQSGLDVRLSHDQGEAVWADVVAMLGQTDLVSPSHLAGVQSPKQEHVRDLAQALRDLLHGDGDYGNRFDAFLAAFSRAFGQAPSWQLATVLPALHAPDEHVCVRPNSFKQQAAWIAPRSVHGRSPSAASYATFLAVAKLVAQKLQEHGHTPRDLMDVYDFIRVTTRSAAKEKALVMKRRLLEEGAAATPTPSSNDTDNEAA